MKTIYLAFAVLFLSQLNAKTYHSFQKGDWSNKYTWTNEDKPAFSFGDTIYISHYVLLDSSLSLTQGAYLQIDSSGSLCGHKILTGNSQSMIYKYGLLQVDSIFLVGGKAIMDGPESVVVWRQISIAGTGASYYQKGGHTEVGPWFECRKRPSENGLSAISYLDHTIYPNPNQGHFYLDLPIQGNGYTLKVFDASGKSILETACPVAGQEISLGPVNPGLYYWVISGPSYFGKGRLVIAR